MNNCAVCGSKLTKIGLIDFCSECNNKAHEAIEGWNKDGNWFWKLLEEKEPIPDNATHGWWPDGVSPEEVSKYNKAWDINGSRPTLRGERNKGNQGYAISGKLYVFRRSDE